MDKNEYKQKLEKHIEALEKAYDNLIEVLNEDVDKDDESNKIKLKDHQVKVYAEGVQKASETANSLLAMIKSKTDELDGLKEDVPQPQKDESPKEEVKEAPKEKSGSAMNKHLN